MGCDHGHGYHGGGCWGPYPWPHGWARGPVDWYEREWTGPEPAYGPEYGPGYGQRFARGPRFAARPSRRTRESEVAQLEAYLADLREELRAVEADLAGLRTGEEAS